MNGSGSSAHLGDRSPTDQLEDDWLLLSSESGGAQKLESSRDEQEAEDRSKLKSRLVSAWNSVKYGWPLKQKSKFSRSRPVVMLGRSYDLKDPGEHEGFRRCFASLLWLTYRRGFPPLDGGCLTTDSGWGCVLRTGQMLLAQALVLHLMPPGWTWSGSPPLVRDDMDLPPGRSAAAGATEPDSRDPSEKRGRRLSLDSRLDRPPEATHRELLSRFSDRPSAPFGIHTLVDLGRSSGKRAGDWYGPSIVAHILRKAVAASGDVPDLAVYVAQDCTVYVEDVKKLCETPRPPHHHHPQSWKSVLILVPVRLGGQELNPSYVDCVKRLLKLRCCVGIIGGKPKHSLFFVGFQGDHLLYLDPHYCQPTVDVTQEDFPLESFHCKYPRKMPFSRMDPSCTIGFYAQKQRDFESLCRDVEQALSTSTETYPMFIFAEGTSQREEGEEGGSGPSTSVTYIQRKSERRRVDTSSSLDEFVLL